MTLLISALCHRCGTTFVREWPGARPRYCPRCSVSIVLLWRFVDDADLPVLAADARELKEWFAR